MKEHLKKLFGLAVLGLLLYSVNLRELADAFSHLTLGSALYLLFISVVMIYVSALKWGLFLDSFGKRMPVRRLFNLYL